MGFVWVPTLRSSSRWESCGSCSWPFPRAAGLRLRQEFEGDGAVEQWRRRGEVSTVEGHRQ